MANTNPLNAVTTALGGQGASAQSSVLNDQLTSITQQLQQLETTNQTQIETMQENTQAVTQNTSTKGSSGGSTAKSVGNTLESVLGFGLGLSPLISGLVSLFGGGGGSSETAPLVPYIAPASVSATAGIGAPGGGAFAVNPASGGLPAPVAASQTTQITVQVQAMDSQSFLDHSNDIAQAVRQAMLTSTTLNDVIRGV